MHRGNRKYGEDIEVKTVEKKGYRYIGVTLEIACVYLLEAVLSKSI